MRTVKRALYLHGFASSPAGRKIAGLRERLEREGIRIIAPDLNVPSFEKLDFAAMTRAARDAGEPRPDVIVGSSLGALVALELSRTGLAAPLLLIAPALGFGRRWIDKLPPEDPVVVFHHGSERELPIHRRFFEELARLDVDRRPPSARVIALMGSNDESVPVDQVRRIWRAWEASGELVSGSRLVEIAGGDHGLVEHLDRIASEIRALTKNGT